MSLAYKRVLLGASPLHPKLHSLPTADSEERAAKMGYVVVLMITMALFSMTMAKPMSNEAKEFYAKLIAQLQEKQIRKYIITLSGVQCILICS